MAEAAAGLIFTNTSYVNNVFQFSSYNMQLICLTMREIKPLLTQIISQASILSIFCKAIDPVMLSQAPRLAHRSPDGVA